jgi:hypothetical protein
MSIANKQGRSHNNSTEIGSKRSEKVEKFKFLGMIINSKNNMTETIQYRIQAGNKAYYANQMMLKNTYINRGAKMQIYKTLFRPVVTYGCEFWAMKKEDENILRRFERKIIRRIYGPVKQQREWRIRNNEESDNIIRKKDIVRFVKARRISWTGHVERMEDSRMPKREMTEKIYTRRKRGRPKVRWLDDVQEDLREMGVEGWRRKAQDRDQWRRITQEAKAHVGL